MNRRRWLVAVGLPAVLIVGAVAAAPWAYTTFVADPPQPAWALPSDSRPAGTGVDGTWTVQPGSQAGYRVQQRLLWERVDVNGRPVRLQIPVTLTLKGVTRPATAQAEIQRNGDRVDVAGTIGIRLPDFNVVPPKPAASLLEVQPDATIEFLVHLAKE